MKKRLLVAGGWVLALLALVAWSVGCDGGIDGKLKQSVRPTVSLTQAPIDTAQDDPVTGLPLQYFYAYKLQWSGHDPDGKVDYFQYAVDPPSQAQAAAGQETTWVRTTKNEQIVFFQATRRDPNSPLSRPTANDFHTFVLKAYDNSGLQSAPESRIFFSYTVAPNVRITNPPPSSLIQPQVSPSVRISWIGSDPDGQFTQKPVKYKFRLYSQNEDRARELAGLPGWITLAVSDPAAFRDSVVFSGFAGYDSSGADTTFASYTNLIPSVGTTVNRYLFVVVGFDEAGAYSPIFSLDSSMLLFTAGFANALGPRFTIFNEYITYAYVSGGYSRPTSPNDRKVIKVQIPADTEIEWNWFADATAGANIAYYRWVLDLNVRSSLDDETERTDEERDWYHWSQRSPSTTTCRMGPFEPGNHWFWIEAEDNNGVRGNAVVYFTVVRPTLERDLLIVDDTRYEADKFQRSPRESLLAAYNITWPAAAELDTFLYARGGHRWRGLPAPQPLTAPGVFAGYRYDTVGTRLGLEDIGRTVTLSTIAPYKHVIWMVDAAGATKQGSGVDPVNPMCSLRYFARGVANPMSAYVSAGGQVWLNGGGIAFASTAPWLARPGAGARPPYGQEFSNADRRELAPGRFMYDIAGWQVQIICSLVRTAFNRYAGPYRTYPGAPPMAEFPTSLRSRSAFLDPVAPPTRELPPGSDAGTFYPPGDQLAVEYISERTWVTEAAGNAEIPSLDTLMVINGGLILTQFPAVPEWVTPIMTYYHPSRRGAYTGLDGIRGSVVTTGFAPWDMTRQDCIALVDFVLQRLWGLNRDNIDRGSAPVAATGLRPATPSSAVAPARRVVQGRLPIGRNRE